MSPTWKDPLVEREDTAEELSEDFAMVFTTEVLWAGSEPKEPPPMEVSGKGMLEQIDKTKH